MFFTTRQQARNYARSTGRRVTDNTASAAANRRWYVRLTQA